MVKRFHKLAETDTYNEASEERGENDERALPRRSYSAPGRAAWSTWICQSLASETPSNWLQASDARSVTSLMIILDGSPAVQKEHIDTQQQRRRLTLNTQMFNGATWRTERVRFVINRVQNNGSTRETLGSCRKAKCTQLFTTAGLCWEPLSIRLFRSSLHSDKVAERRQRLRLLGRLRGARPVGGALLGSLGESSRNLERHGYAPLTNARRARKARAVSLRAASRTCEGHAARWRCRTALCRARAPTPNSDARARFVVELMNRIHARSKGRRPIARLSSPRKSATMRERAWRRPPRSAPSPRRDGNRLAGRCSLGTPV